MSAQMIIICAVGGGLLLATIFYLSFVHENQTNKLAKQIAKISEKIRRYQTFLECFPDGYLPKDVRAILAEEIISNLHSQSKLEPSNPRFARLIEETKVIKENILKEKPRAPNIGAINDIKMAKELQVRLKNLFAMLTHIGKTRKHHTNAINKNLKILKGIYVETAVSVHKTTAARAREQGKTKLAIHHYNQVIGEYARNDAKQFAGKISELRATVQQLNEQLKKEQDNKNKEAVAKKQAQQAQNKNTHGLDKMNTSGMKKRSY